MEQYVYNLIELYKNATGLKKVDMNDKIFQQEFTDWLIERQSIGKQYTSFLDSMEITYKDDMTAEVGKGYIDSVVKDYDTMLITPYSKFKNIEKRRIIKANFDVYEDVPIIKTFDGEVKLFDSIPNYIIKTYMMHNPYNNGALKNWENLHNSKQNDIIVGYYGNITDKDFIHNIKNLDEFKSKLDDDIIFDFDYQDGNYFYTIGSKRKQIENVKVLTR